MGRRGSREAPAAVDRPLRLAVYSHALTEQALQIRWRLLAERHPVEVHLVVPGRWISDWLGDRRDFRACEEHDGRFHVHPTPTTSRRSWGKYLLLSVDGRMRAIRPDVIYTIHEEMILLHHQLLAYRRLWCPTAKYAFFTMHALGVPQATWHQRLRWRGLRRGADAAVCHYPGCLQSLRAADFAEPVFLQTQVGVNERLFYPDDDSRRRMRARLGWEGRFVVGHVGRICTDKGVDVLLDAMPLQRDDWALLLVGDGDFKREAQQLVAERGWQERVHFTGMVPLAEVPHWVRAMDCFVLGSRTTPHWIDTFPLVTVQAMACGVPVVGSDSASLPWQIGDAGVIVPEGDPLALREVLEALARDPARRSALAERGRRRSLANFCVTGLADRFYEILQQIHTGDWRADLPEEDQRRAYLP